MLVNRPVLVASLASPLALALIVGGMFVAHAKLERVTPHRLVLDAPETVGCYYSSAWHNGDVIVDHDPTGETLVYTRQLPWRDGCTWVSTETLTPSGDGEWVYRYLEHAVACPAGHDAWPSCNRSGVVHIGDARDARLADVTPEDLVESTIPDATREDLMVRACDGDCPGYIRR